ncbi:hypothetical protein EDD22DRAFT_880183 [Suillus occidentalis]|nr:hypothetical protein EDD22DRAFT_880183 [Suillus occidentalis]
MTLSSAFAPQEHCFKLYKATNVPSISISGVSRENTGHSVQVLPVVLFMKGSPERPICGFSRGVANILSAFDISSRHIMSFH